MIKIGHTIMRSFAKTPTPIAARVIGQVAVSRYFSDSGTSTKNWPFLGSLLFLFFSIPAIFLFKVSVGPSCDKVFNCLRNMNILWVTPDMIGWGSDPLVPIFFYKGKRNKIY